MSLISKAAPATAKVQPPRPEMAGLVYPRRPDGGIKGGQIGTPIVTNAELLQIVQSGTTVNPEGGFWLDIRIAIGDGVNTPGALHMTGDSPNTGEGNAGTCFATWAKGKVALGGFPCPVSGRDDAALSVTLTVESDRFIPDQETINRFGKGTAPKVAPVGTFRVPAPAKAPKVAGK